MSEFCVNTLLMGVPDGIEAHSLEGFGVTSVCDCQAISKDACLASTRTSGA